MKSTLPIVFLIFTCAISFSSSTNESTVEDTKGETQSSVTEVAMKIPTKNNTFQTTQTMLTHEESNKTCMNLCRMMDSDLHTCWKASLEYHASELSEKLENFYSALLHVSYWRNQNKKPEEDPDLEESIINGTTSDRRPDENLSNEKIAEVLRLLLDEVSSRRPEYEDEDAHLLLPRLPCPIPCDYYPQIWMSLTIVFATALGLCILVFLLYFFCDAWNVARRAKFHTI